MRAWQKWRKSSRNYVLLAIFSKDVDTLSDAVTQLSVVGRGLREMADTLCSNNSSSGNCLTSTITFLSTSLQSLRTGYLAWRSSLPENPLPVKSKEAGEETPRLPREIALPHEADSAVASFAEKVEQLVESALLSIQKVVKSGEEERKKKAAEKSAGEDLDEEEECGLKQNHLTHLTEQLQKQVSFLHLEQASFEGLGSRCLSSHENLVTLSKQNKAHRNPTPLLK